MNALKQALTDEGFVLADEQVQLVVASMDRDLTYEKLKRASLLIRACVRFIATNLDPTFPSDEGILPDTGSIIARLETASGVKPQAIGKPELMGLIQHDWRGVDVQTAETMAFLTLSLCELFRAYTVRSERASLFTIGVFSNKYMQYAVGLSIALLLLVTATPFLQPIFNTHFLAPHEWLTVLMLALIPAISEEITKFFLRLGENRQPAKRGLKKC